MIQPFDLLTHAGELLSESASEADVRRAISACYYALFHLLSAQAAVAVAGSGNDRLVERIRRGVQHHAMRKVCEAVRAGKALRPIDGLMTEPVSPHLREVAGAFIELQDVRHTADYDLTMNVSSRLGRSYLIVAQLAFQAWDRVQHDADTHVFLVAVLLADRWTRRG